MTGRRRENRSPIRTISNPGYAPCAASVSAARSRGSLPSTYAGTGVANMLSKSSRKTSALPVRLRTTT